MILSLKKEIKLYMSETFETIRKTCHEMIEIRRYSVQEEDDQKIVVLKPNGNLCYFIFSTSSSFNINNAKEIMSLLHEDGIEHAIIVYNGQITPYAKNTIEHETIRIELFQDSELLYNPTKHRLVPKHVKLDEEKSKQISLFDKANYPVILRTDPISRFCGFERGDVIKIVRQNGYITYRIVR